MDYQLSDTLRDYELEAEFDGDGRTVIHIIRDTTRPSSAPHLREKWESEKQPIGSGGYAKVFLQNRIRINSNGPEIQRALKVVKCGNDSTRQQYLRELETMARFSHKKYTSLFVKMIGWYVDCRADLCIAMDYYPEGDLHTYLQKQSTPGLPETDAQEIVSQVLQGLATMHQLNFVHRDIKPQNLMIQQCPPNPWWIKLADFGISKRIDLASASVTEPVGTHEYMAPELLLRSNKMSEVDYQKSDIWAMGAMASYILNQSRGFLNERLAFDKEPSSAGLLLQHFSHSQIAQSFIIETTKLNPAERLDWRKAAQHDWIKEQIDSSSLLGSRNSSLPPSSFPSFNSPTPENPEDEELTSLATYPREATDAAGMQVDPYLANKAADPIERAQNSDEGDPERQISIVCAAKSGDTKAFAAAGSKDAEKCLQLFRLTTSSRDSTYEWYKDCIEERVSDTCLWFLQHAYFHQWLQRESGPLVVTADPGCGKSVLAKYLIDHELPRTSTICYFFFKAQDQNTTKIMLCAIIHQLFIQQGHLLQHAVDRIRTDGPGLINSTSSLWRILQEAIQDPSAKPTTIVLDALDECDGLVSTVPEFKDLVKGVKSLFKGHPPNQSKLKLLLTCRPYEQVVSELRCLQDDFPSIRIPGEGDKESEIISQEINQVIEYRVRQLSLKRNLPDKVRDHLVQRLQATEHRTYLWAYLICEHLETTDIKKTEKGLDSAIETLPPGVPEAYEQILRKSTDRPMAKKVLNMILAAIRPLTLSELNVAVSMNSDIKDEKDLDLEDAETFIDRLRGWCGLMVSVRDEKASLIHQTARDFLLAKSSATASMPLGTSWQHSLRIEASHRVLMRICVSYLRMWSPDKHYQHSLKNYKFLSYAAVAWDTHYHSAGNYSDDTVTLSILELCQQNERFAHLCAVSDKFEYYNGTSLEFATALGLEPIVKLLLDRNQASVQELSSSLYLASSNGTASIVKHLIDYGANVEKQLCSLSLDWRKQFGESRPLFMAANQGHVAAVDQLLRHNANMEARDHSGQSPLFWAAREGRDAVVELLLNRGADPCARDNFHHTALWWATFRRQPGAVRVFLAHLQDNTQRRAFSEEPMLCAIEEGRGDFVKLLLENGAGTEATVPRRSPLVLAAEKGLYIAVKLLLDYGAKVDQKDSHFEQTPLIWAAQHGHMPVVVCLLENGANKNAKDFLGRTALWWAVECDHTDIFQHLIATGARSDFLDNVGQTLLHRVSQHGRDAMVQFLCKLGNNFEYKSSGNRGKTSLSLAAGMGHDNTVGVILGPGVNLESQDNNGLTPLLLAAANGHCNTVAILLRHGSHKECQDKEGRTPLSLAAGQGRGRVVRVLCEQGADLCSEDQSGRTPLRYALLAQHEEVALTLLNMDCGRPWPRMGARALLECAVRNQCNSVVRKLRTQHANIEEIDQNGHTLLTQAAEEGSRKFVVQLLKCGAKIDGTDNSGRTALSIASGAGHLEIVKELLDMGAQVESKDGQGRTPLMWAAWKRQAKVVRELINVGADVDCGDMEGRNSLWYVPLDNCDATIQALFSEPV